jgi:hypothetical protein
VGDDLPENDGGVSSTGGGVALFLVVFFFLEIFLMACLAAVANMDSRPRVVALLVEDDVVELTCRASRALSWCAQVLLGCSLVVAIFSVPVEKKERNENPKGR